MRTQHLAIFVAIAAIFVIGTLAFSKDLTAPDPEIAVLDTTMGKITFEFYPNAAPKHVENFKALARKGFYDGVKFHRVIKGFMIQAGDPNSKDNDPSNDGAGNAGYTLKAEFSSIQHKRGIVSMARRGDSVDTASCQFFIVHQDSSHLDNQYTVFGRVISGMDVVDKIANTPVGPRDYPKTPIVINKVTIEKRTAAASK
ncbi:MAG TPA: peptidylprolyl isomerase [Acidobacteriota bacterium]|nr:peptidylprolyl isomerase [Acidobacteriota bacterium]